MQKINIIKRNTLAYFTAEVLRFYYNNSLKNCANVIVKVIIFCNN